MSGRLVGADVVAVVLVRFSQEQLVRGMADVVVDHGPFVIGLDEPARLEADQGGVVRGHANHIRAAGDLRGGPLQGDRGRKG